MIAMEFNAGVAVIVIWAGLYAVGFPVAWLWSRWMRYERRVDEHRRERDRLDDELRWREVA